MTEATPNHYSYKFKFDIDKLPAIQKDRLSRKLAFCGLLFGAVFIALSLFEAAVYFSNNETAVQITGESKTPVFAASADGGNGVLSYITNRPMIMNHDLVMRTVNFLNGIN